MAPYLATTRGLEPLTSSVTGRILPTWPYGAADGTRTHRPLRATRFPSEPTTELSHCCVWRCGSDSNRRITDLQSVPLDQSRAPHRMAVRVGVEPTGRCRLLFFGTSRNNHFSSSPYMATGEGLEPPNADMPRHLISNQAPCQFGHPAKRLRRV